MPKVWKESLYGYNSYILYRLKHLRLLHHLVYKSIFLYYNLYLAKRYNLQLINLFPLQNLELHFYKLVLEQRHFNHGAQFPVRKRLQDVAKGIGQLGAGNHIVCHKCG